MSLMNKQHEESGLVQHAKRELALTEPDPWMRDGIVRVVEAFARMGHSGGSAAYAIPVIHELLQFHNLAPLTDDPKEWNKVGDYMWQNNRCSEAFSADRGITYWLLSEGANAQNRIPMHRSEHKE